MIYVIKKSIINYKDFLLSFPFVRSLIIYTAGDVVGKLIPFILLPIIAHYLSPADFGVLNNYTAITQILISICAFNTYTALTIYYNQIPESDLPNCISNLLYLILFAGLACVLIIPGLLHFMGDYLNIKITWLYVSLATAVATTIVSLYASFLRIENKALPYNYVQIAQALIGSFTGLIFVAVLNLGWQGRIFSLFLAPAALATFALWSWKRDRLVFVRPDKTKIANYFFFGLPLLPHTLSFSLKPGIDKLIISSFVSIADNGVYSISLTLASVVGLFTNSFFNAYAPKFYGFLKIIDESSIVQSNLIKKKLVIITYAYAIFLGLFIVLSYFALATSVPFLFKHDYSAATNYLPIILVASFFDGMYSIVSGYVFYRKKTNVLGSITFTTAIFQMTMTLVLVHFWGVYGAAISSALTSFITFILVFRYSSKLYEFSWKI
jgi:O-antigen/teichoic acid export membrane protein